MSGSPEPPPFGTRLREAAHLTQSEFPVDVAVDRALEGAA